MAKIIAITGATGAQGGGVANVLFDTPGWKVRAVTRNTTSDKAKSLASRGAEVVQANFDDEASLVKAFEGAHAIYGVTNFWEHPSATTSLDEAGRLEAEQAIKLARAASNTPTLEHYIWSTLPSARNTTNGKILVPHIDYKADVDDRIRSELPELAKKTTFLYYGYYLSNMAFFPMLKPIEYPGAYGKYAQIVATPADSLIPVSGDMTVTPGIWVRQILANPGKTLGKYAAVATETTTFGNILKLWSEVTGRPAVYLPTSAEAWEQLWGIHGKEIAAQLAWGEVFPDWTLHIKEQFVSKEELGITEEEAPGVKKILESLKPLL